jgi:2-polyprenyl-3-methyl-5-hydroxy-6-metoxy-1,4-benzoquinol methylase
LTHIAESLRTTIIIVAIAEEFFRMVSLDARDRQPELMDQPGLDDGVHRRALAGLRTVNMFSRTAKSLWQGLADVGVLGSGPIRVLDIAAGGGDNALRLAARAQQAGVNLTSHGCDISPTAVAHAQAVATRSGMADIQYFQLNALRDPLPDGYDVLMCTLFMHHLEEDDAVELLRRMAEAANRAVLVDDIVRSRFGYVLAWAGGRLLTRSPIIHVDGPLSVRAAFSLDEARAIVERAGLHGAQFRRHWPERFLMSWRKP